MLGSEWFAGKRRSVSLPGRKTNRNGQGKSIAAIALVVFGSEAALFSAARAIK
jgi:hypothetical protein